MKEIGGEKKKGRKEVVRAGGEYISGFGPPAHDVRGRSVSFYLE